MLYEFANPQRRDTSLAVFISLHLLFARDTERQIGSAFTGQFKNRQDHVHIFRSAPTALLDLDQPTVDPRTTFCSGAHGHETMECAMSKRATVTAIVLLMATSSLAYAAETSSTVGMRQPSAADLNSLTDMRVSIVKAALQMTPDVNCRPLFVICHEPCSVSNRLHIQGGAPRCGS